MAEPLHVLDVYSGSPGVPKLRWKLCFDSPFSAISLDIHTKCRLQSVVEWDQLRCSLETVTAKSGCNSFLLNEFQITIFCSGIPCTIGDVIEGRMGAFLYHCHSAKKISITELLMSQLLGFRSNELMEGLQLMQRLINSGILLDRYEFDLLGYVTTQTRLMGKEAVCAMAAKKQEFPNFPVDLHLADQSSICLIRFNQNNKLIDFKITAINIEK